MKWISSHFTYYFPLKVMNVNTKNMIFINSILGWLLSKDMIICLKCIIYSFADSMNLLKCASINDIIQMFVSLTSSSCARLNGPSLKWNKNYFGILHLIEQKCWQLKCSLKSLVMLF